MLYLLDSNILLYSKMDAMPEHQSVSRWLEETLSDTSSTVAISETSILSFLRIATNANVFDPPLPFDEAISFITSFLTHPGVQILKTSPEHYISVVEFMKKHNFGGNLARDAHLAVLALGSGAVLATCDTDFKKVSYLKILNPLAL